MLAFRLLRLLKKNRREKNILHISMYFSIMNDLLFLTSALILVGIVGLTQSAAVGPMSLDDTWAEYRIVHSKNYKPSEESKRLEF
jgi:lysine/ornithine N-monooxygenase